MGYTDDNTTIKTEQEASTSYTWSPAVERRGEDPACVTEAGKAMLAKMAKEAKLLERQPMQQRHVLAGQKHLPNGETCEVLGVMRFPSIPTRLGVAEAPMVVSLPEPEKENEMTPCKRLRAGIKRIEAIDWHIFKEVPITSSMDAVNNLRAVMYQFSAGLLAILVLCAYNGENSRTDANMHSLFFFVAIATFIGLFMTAFINFLALFHNSSPKDVMWIRVVAKFSMATLAVIFMFMSYTSDKNLTACEHMEGPSTRCDKAYLYAMNTCVMLFVNIVIFAFHSIPDYMQSKLTAL